MIIHAQLIKELSPMHDSGTYLAYLSVLDTFQALVSYHAFFLPALKTEANRIASRKTGGNEEGRLIN